MTDDFEEDWMNYADICHDLKRLSKKMILKKMIFNDFQSSSVYFSKILRRIYDLPDEM